VPVFAHFRLLALLTDRVITILCTVFKLNSTKNAQNGYKLAVKTVWTVGRSLRSIITASLLASALVSPIVMSVPLTQIRFCILKLELWILKQTKLSLQETCRIRNWDKCIWLWLYYEELCLQCGRLPTLSPS